MLRKLIGVVALASAVWPSSAARQPSILKTLSLAEHVEREPWFRHEHHPFGRAFRQREARGHDNMDVRVALPDKIREFHAVNLPAKLTSVNIIDTRPPIFARTRNAV